MSDFIERRRQQFLTEQYYEPTKLFYIEDVDYWKVEDSFEDDEYNCGEDKRWTLITNDYKFLLYLQYTAGEDIGGLAPLFEKVIEGYEKQTEALAIFNKTQRPSILTNIFEMLSVIGLAYLLNRRDLLPRITTLINGENGGRLIEDAITSRFLHINDSQHPVLDYEADETLYNRSHVDWCKALDAVNDEENKKRIIKSLDDYLSDWYSLNKFEVWYNSHLAPPDEMRYCGYWAFEAAALAYLLDLDDTPLHKHLFYPKDIVAWARKNNTQSKVNQDNSTVLKVKAGEKCTKTGYWNTPAQPNQRNYFKLGEILPTLSELDWGEVYWYFDSEE